MYPYSFETCSIEAMCPKKKKKKSSRNEWWILEHHMKMEEHSENG
jgi:hypothetical protein